MAEEKTIRTPGELLYKFNEAVWAKGTTGMVSVKGVYSRQEFEISDSKYIDKLVDEVNEARINIIVTESIRKAVKDGNVVTVTGYLDRYMDNRDGSIRLQIRVVNMDILAQSSVLTAKEIELSAIRHKKMKDGYKPIDTLLTDKLEKTNPRVALIYPSSSIVQHDFWREIGDMEEHYIFEEIRTPFSNINQLSETLGTVDSQSFDAICLVRGGGSDFGALESSAVLEFIVGMKTPIIAAVGHENDTLFINEVVDKYFSTPTSLGGYFRRLAEDVDRKQAKVEALKEDLILKRLSIYNMKRWLIAAVIAVVVLIAVCAFLASRLSHVATVVE